MKQAIGALTFLALVSAAPMEPARAQDALLGGLLGGAAGAAIGGAVSGSAGGAIAGGLIGGATGAIIGNEAERRRNGYYYYRRGCYVQVGYNQWRRVSGRYCY
jgi:hypothetical protein